MFTVDFTCNMNNNFIVMADQDKMIENVTQHVKNWIESQKAGCISVETFYNRTMNRGVIRCNTYRKSNGIVSPATYTTHTYVADIIFHT